jgi:hypothetical protein
VFLRLPPSLSSDQTSGGLRIGLQRAFYLVAILELSAALLCFWKLRPDQGPSEARASLAKECRRVLLGFRLVFTDGELAVASFSVRSRCLRHSALTRRKGMTARAATIVASLFIPLYIAQYFARSGRCDVDPSTPATKEGCREAYILSSSLTGTLQVSPLRPRKAPRNLCLACVSLIRGHYWNTWLQTPLESLATGSAGNDLCHWRYCLARLGLSARSRSFSLRIFRSVCRYPRHVPNSGSRFGGYRALFPSLRRQRFGSRSAWSLEQERA